MHLPIGLKRCLKSRCQSGCGNKKKHCESEKYWGEICIRAKISIFVDADTLVPMKVIQEVLDLMKDPKFGGGGATIEFDCNHGRFFFWNFDSATLESDFSNL